MKLRLALCAALAMLAGCSGGGNSGAPMTPGGGHPGQSASASLKITIPARTTKSAGRRPLFVSPSSNGILVNVYKAGSGDKTPIASTAIDISSGNKNCTTNPNGSRTCTVAFAAPSGADDFVFIDYDAKPVNGAFNGANELSQTTVSNVTITANAQNTVNATLEGVVATMSLPAPVISFLGNAGPLTAPLSLAIKDADGNTIASDGLFNPITVSLTETNGSGHTKLSLNGAAGASSVTIAQATDVVNLVYDGAGSTSASAPYYASLSITANKVASITALVAPLYAITSPSPLQFTASGQSGSVTLVQQSFTGASYSLDSASCVSKGVLSVTAVNSKQYNLTSGQSNASPCDLVASDGISKDNVTVNPTNGGGGIGVPTPAPAPGAPAGITKIQHIVIVIQENRTFNHMFYGFPGADTATTGLRHDGTVATISPISLAAGISPGHLHNDWVIDYAKGQMNGWDVDDVQQGNPRDYAYTYINHSETTLYFNMAKAYALGDRFFTTNNGASFPAHQYLVAGQANNAEDTPQLAGVQRLNAWGCDSPPGSSVTVLDPATGLSTPNLSPSNPFPCFDYPTLSDQLDAKGLSWAFYASVIGAQGSAQFGQFNSLDAVSHIRYSSAWTTNVITPETQILTDIAAGKLANVTWVTCNLFNTCDHPLQIVTTSPQWPTAVVDAVGKSSFWNSSVIFIMWDDWGGFYDQVVPPQLDQLGLGMRVGFIIVSPYAKVHYVSHVQHEFCSVLRFAEEDFGLHTMASCDARADDLRDIFNFSQAPTPFTPFDKVRTKAYFDGMRYMGRPYDEP